jgi:hypothetical protein
VERTYIYFTARVNHKNDLVTARHTSVSYCEALGPIGGSVVWQQVRKVGGSDGLAGNPI